MKIICIAVVFLFILLPSYVNGQVKINEFSPDTSPQTVELYNEASISADISGWFIDDSGGQTYYTIPQQTILYPNSCMVFSQDFNLNKSSPDSVRLFNQTGNPTTVSAILIDSYSYKTSPGIGNSYARYPDGSDSWEVSESSWGMFNKTKLSCLVYPTPTLTPLPTFISPVLNENDVKTDNFPRYEGIYISEVMVYPESNQHEWIELYNSHDYKITLTNWYIDDLKDHGSTPRKINVELPAFGYASVELTSSIFNNDTDQVRLLNEELTEKDSFEYSGAHQGETFGRIDFQTDSFCLQKPSKDYPNTDCIILGITNFISSTERKEKPLSKISPTSFPKKTYITQKNSYSQPEIFSSPQVLGISTNHISPYLEESIGPIILQLLFLSVSYSILTIISLLFKIKNGLKVVL